MQTARASCAPSLVVPTQLGRKVQCWCSLLTRHLSASPAESKSARSTGGHELSVKLLAWVRARPCAPRIVHLVDVVHPRYHPVRSRVKSQGRAGKGRAARCMRLKLQRPQWPSAPGRGHAQPTTTRRCPSRIPYPLPRPVSVADHRKQWTPPTKPRYSADVAGVCTDHCNGTHYMAPDGLRDRQSRRSEPNASAVGGAALGHG